MGPDIEKLMRWFDKKTGYGYDHEGLAHALSTCREVPPAKREALRKFKRKSWDARRSLTSSYLATTAES